MPGVCETCWNDADLRVWVRASLFLIRRRSGEFQHGWPRTLKMTAEGWGGGEPVYIKIQDVKQRPASCLRRTFEMRRCWQRVMQGCSVWHSPSREWWETAEGVKGEEEGLSSTPPCSAPTHGVLQLLFRQPFRVHVHPQREEGLILTQNAAPPPVRGQTRGSFSSECIKNKQVPRQRYHLDERVSTEVQFYGCKVCHDLPEEQS